MTAYPVRRIDPVADAEAALEAAVRRGRAVQDGTREQQHLAARCILDAAGEWLDARDRSTQTKAPSGAWRW